MVIMMQCHFMRIMMQNPPMIIMMQWPLHENYDAVVIVANKYEEISWLMQLLQINLEEWTEKLDAVITKQHSVLVRAA